MVQSMNCFLLSMLMLPPSKKIYVQLMTLYPGPDQKAGSEMRSFWETLINMFVYAEGYRMKRTLLWFTIYSLYMYGIDASFS